MNILFYCSEYPPFPTGGIGSVTKIIAESLALKGHNIFVIGYYQNMYHLPMFSEINGVKIYRLHKTYQDGKLKTTTCKILNKLNLSRPFIQKELTFTENFISNIIKQENIDLIEFTDYYTFNNQAPNLRYQSFSIPTILRIHGCASFIQELKGHPNLRTKQNDQSHFNRCNYLSAVSQYSLNYIQQNFDTSNFNKEIVINNPIEDSFLKQNSPSNSNTILFIGKLTESKGCYSLLKAFNACADKFPKIELHLAGNGDIKKAKSYINPKFINRVQFLGYCNRKTIQQEIDNCIFACIPTYFETFGMVALEIMARQRALIFTERTSGKEIIKDEFNGYTVNPENIDQIAEKMEFLITNTSLRNKIAINGYETIQSKYTVSKVSEKIIDFYNTILKNYIS